MKFGYARVSKNEQNLDIQIGLNYRNGAKANYGA